MAEQSGGGKGRGWNGRRTKVIHRGSSSGLYFFGFLGAAIYFIQASDGFWQGVLGFLKAIVWPVFLVYELLKFVGA